MTMSEFRAKLDEFFTAEDFYVDTMFSESK